MTFDSPFLLRRLQTLHRQIAEAPRHGESLQAARDGCDRRAGLCALIDAQRHVRDIVVTTRRIKEQVVPTDGLGTLLESLSELVLRGVRMVVLAEVGTLRDLVREPSACGRSRTLRWGQFRDIEDLTTRVHTDLDRITDQWRTHRGVAASERVAYRAALRAAHAAMRALGTTSEFARFLAEGVLRPDWPELQGACARAGAALTIPLDVDPDVPVLVIAWRPHDEAERAS